MTPERIEDARRTMGVLPPEKWVELYGADLLLAAGAGITEASRAELFGRISSASLRVGMALVGKVGEFLGGGIHKARLRKAYAEALGALTGVADTFRFSASSSTTGEALGKINQFLAELKAKREETVQGEPDAKGEETEPRSTPKPPLIHLVPPSFQEGVDTPPSGTSEPMLEVPSNDPQG